MSDTLTKEELAWALMAVLNGVKKHELPDLTGFDDDEDNTRVWDTLTKTVSTYGWNFKLSPTQESND